MHKHMNMEPKIMSAASGLITLGTKKAANFISYISFILCCIFYSWIIVTLQELYSSFHRIVQFFSYGDRNVITTLNDLCLDNNNNNSNITRKDAEIVMENLGLKVAFVHDSFDIANVFDGREPSLDEVREAFGMFDENDDGFIDADELRKIMSSIGLTGFCEQECRRMIMAYDDNGDGKIDFGEFMKLMEDCSC